MQALTPRASIPRRLYTGQWEQLRRTERTPHSCPEWRLEITNQRLFLRRHQWKILDMAPIVLVPLKSFATLPIQHCSLLEKKKLFSNKKKIYYRYRDPTHTSLLAIPSRRIGDLRNQFDSSKSKSLINDKTFDFFPFAKIFFYLFFFSFHPIPNSQSQKYKKKFERANVFRRVKKYYWCLLHHPNFFFVSLQCFAVAV